MLRLERFLDGKDVGAEAGAPISKDTLIENAGPGPRSKKEL